MNALEDRPLAGRSVVTFANARIVLADEVIVGHVSIADDRIVAIDTGVVPLGSVDLEGDYLLPGLIDVHTDHFEKHVYPRAHVRWDFVSAALAHDAQIVGGGVTTVFDSLCVGATYDNPERREILGPMIDALEWTQNASMLRAEHLVHLRCEITDEETPALVERNLARGIVRIASVMEHLPGVRQSRDVDSYVLRVQKRTGRNAEMIRSELEALVAERASIGTEVRPQVVALVRDFGLPLFSHDDTDEEHIDQALAEGIVVAEFPCTLPAARKARSGGMSIVAGAPNLLCGGSQSGNVAVEALMTHDLVDVLASDYVPRSLLDCVFRVAGAEALARDLAAAVRMVSKTPAEIAGLDDRGEIAVGKRADLIQVGLRDERPFLKQAWRAGRRIY